MAFGNHEYGSGLSLALGALLATVLLTGLLLVGLSVFRSPASAVILYDKSVVDSNYDPLCPGDRVYYRNVARIKNTPAMVWIGMTVWSVDSNRTVIVEEQPTYTIYTEPTTIQFSGAYTLPLDLPPGRYELRRASNGEGRTTATFTVPFTIRNGCGKAN